jgi:hypothetical protein
MWVYSLIGCRFERRIGSLVEQVLGQHRVAVVKCVQQSRVERPLDIVAVDIDFGVLDQIRHLVDVAIDASLHQLLDVCSAGLCNQSSCLSACCATLLAHMQHIR